MINKKMKKKMNIYNKTNTYKMIVKKSVKKKIIFGIGYNITRKH